MLKSNDILLNIKVLDTQLRQFKSMQVTFNIEYESQNENENEEIQYIQVIHTHS